jgi:hypothetical protein
VRILAAVLTAVVLAAPAHAAPGDDYNIMKPEPGRRAGGIFEPWLAPKYKSPRGTRQHVVAPSPVPDEPRRIPDMPPPLVAPRSGQALPNIAPPVPGSGRGGRETFQDRAARCTHQAGGYGETGSYIGACINQ